MPIGQLGSAPDVEEQPAGPVLSGPLYWFYEWGQAALNPSRALADATRFYFKNPLNPLSQTEFGKNMAAAAELFERTTRRYAKPEWGIDSTLVGGERVPVTMIVSSFCVLLASASCACDSGAPAASAAAMASGSVRGVFMVSASFVKFS